MGDPNKFNKSVGFNTKCDVDDLGYAGYLQIVPNGIRFPAPLAHLGRHLRRRSVGRGASTGAHSVGRGVGGVRGGFRGDGGVGGRRQREPRDQKPWIETAKNVRSPCTLWKVGLAPSINSLMCVFTCFNFQQKSGFAKQKLSFHLHMNLPMGCANFNWDLT